MESPQKDPQNESLLKKLETSIEKRLGRFLDRYGHTDFRLTVITVVFIFFTGGDALITVYNKFGNLSASPVWKHIEKQSHDVLTTQSPYATGHHVSKMTFRLVAPLLGKLCLGCNLHMMAYFLVGLNYLSGFVFIFLFIRFLRNYISDHATVRWLTLCLGSMILGKTFFWDWIYFDGFALVSLMIAMMSRRIPVQFIFFLIAFWTDERAVVSLPLIWLWYFLKDKAENQTAAIPDFTVFEVRKGHVAMLLALACTILGRWVLIEYYNFSTSVDFAQILREAFGIIRKGRLANLYPFILFNSFESMWLMIGIAFYLAWHHREKLEVVFLSIFSLLAVGSAFLVVDITRSIMYAFPVLIISLRFVAAYLPATQLRRISFYMLLFAIIYPTYFMTDYMFPFFIRALIFRTSPH
jgi:hypothetical protein